MDWKSHLVFGFFSGAMLSLFAFRAGLQEAFLFAAVSGAASLLPDLDLRKSKASQALYSAVFVLILAAAFLLSYKAGKAENFVLYAAALFLAALGLDFLIRPRHRGIMHSLAFLFALALPCFLLFGEFLACAVAAGYFSHLLADFCVKLA